MFRRWTALFLCSIPAALSTESFAAKDPAATLNATGITFPTQAKPGNIFIAGEKVQLDAAISAGDAIDWTITDYQGRSVATGTAKIADGKITIEPSLGIGFYLLHLNAKPDAPAKAEGVTSFAIIPLLDNATMSDTRFGVASHFGKNMSTDLVPILAKAGIAHVRDSPDWNRIETKPGIFDFTAHDFVNKMADLQKNHIAPCITAAFGNALHFDDPKIPAWQAAPHTPEQYQAYTRLCTEYLKQFGTQIKALEIWNEYNGSFCAGPAAKDRPKYYTEMLQDAYKAIKAVRPDVQVIGGAMVKIPLPYAEKLFKLGALDSMDAIAVHPYEPTPEGVDHQIRQLVDLMKKYNHGVAKPIWVTEIGTWQDPSLERAAAAAYLVKMYTVLLAQPEVERAYWYLARDYDEFPIEGLVHNDASPMGKYTPTTNYSAFAAMVNALHHTTPGARIDTDPRTRVYRFDRGNEAIWVCWSTTQSTALSFQTLSPLHLMNMVGGEQWLSPADGIASVAVSDQPVYVVADRAVAVTAVRESPRSDQVIADSVNDFSNTQGRGGWSYLWCTNNKDGSAAYDPDKLEPMTWTPSPGDWFDSWAGPGEWFKVTETGASPSANRGKQQWAIRRWTSTLDGPVHVLAKIDRPNPNGDGTGCKVFLDGHEIYTKSIRPKGHEELNLELTLKKGSRLDFAVTPGPGTDANYDNATFRITILTPKDH